jgi:formylglycine-generating enzyme required for sulfatase activity
MVHIPGGTFDMGSNEGGDDEKPVHAVRLAPFSIDRTEVTVAAYAVCVGAGRCTTADHGRKDACNAGKSDRRDHPINCVDWSQAAAYCAYAGKRLPTEEEWEYVARGPEGRIYPWGDAEPSSQLCWSRDAGQGTCAVGSHPSGASPFGVLDMAGDALEWTKSPYCSYSGGDCAESFRVVRGGSWGVLAAMAVRGGVRGKLAPSYRSHYLGFRCAQGD